ncbi:MAG: uracil-DNA glycosylase [bacterium]
MSQGQLYQDYLEVVKSFRRYLEERRGMKREPEVRKDKPEEKDSRVLLEDLCRSMQNCQSCSLHGYRIHLVFGAGNPEAELMLVGEAPGREEDLQGKPFVGAAGKLLTEGLSQVGLSREEVYIGNILKCRPPGNRDPLPEEIRACFPYLERQIEIIGPRIICTLGKFAAQVLLDTSQGITHLRGKPQWYKNNITLLPTYHPAACIYKPAWKKTFLGDLKMVRDELGKKS